jgi:hypothetical protein
VQFTDLHLEMRSGKLGLDFTQFDNTISSTGEGMMKRCTAQLPVW